jgi:hypothetical protein
MRGPSMPTPPWRPHPDSSYDQNDNHHYSCHHFYGIVIQVALFFRRRAQGSPGATFVAGVGTPLCSSVQGSPGATFVAGVGTPRCNGFFPPRSTRSASRFVFSFPPSPFASEWHWSSSWAARRPQWLQALVPVRGRGRPRGLPAVRCGSGPMRFFCMAAWRRPVGPSSPVCLMASAVLVGCPPSAVAPGLSLWLLHGGLPWPPSRVHVSFGCPRGLPGVRCGSGLACGPFPPDLAQWLPRPCVKEKRAAMCSH